MEPSLWLERFPPPEGSNLGPLYQQASASPTELPGEGKHERSMRRKKLVL